MEWSQILLLYKLQEKGYTPTLWGLRGRKKRIYPSLLLALVQNHKVILSLVLLPKTLQKFSSSNNYPTALYNPYPILCPTNHLYQTSKTQYMPIKIASQIIEHSCQFTRISLRTIQTHKSHLALILNENVLKFSLILAETQK